MTGALNIYCLVVHFILATANFYELLGLPPHAKLSPSDVKQAYHRKLLRDHPDKIKSSAESDELTSVAARQSDASSSNRPDANFDRETVDVVLIRQAYLTLSNPALRRVYDASSTRNAEPRPAQVVSLEDFAVSYGNLDGEAYSAVYEHICRCGGMYRISEAQLEKDVHLVGCDSCSEIIWVGYEVEEDQGGREHEDVN